MTDPALIDFITKPGDVPADVSEQAVRALANVVGVALGGVEEAAARSALAAMAELGGEPQARVLGMGVALPVDRVAVVDGVLAHVLDYDDTHLETILHPSAPVLAALLPLAEHRDVSGAELLAAWIVGLEVGVRVALALGFAHYDAGWHVTGTAGGIAAAAACARLLRLSKRETANALGIAATQSCGHREQFGYMSKSLHIGVAGQVGLTAAVLSAHGFDSAPGSLTGRRGLLHVMAPEPHAGRLTHQLGEQWDIRGNFLKPYASGVVTHPAIDGARALRDEYGLTPSDLDRVELDVHPLVLELTGKREPRSGLEGKFSVWHCAAMGLQHGLAGPRQFGDDVVCADETAAVRALFHVQASDDVAHMTARVRARRTDGRTLEFTVDPTRGTPQRPLTDAELRAKFVDAASIVLELDDADAAFDAWLAIADARSVRDVLSTCQARARR